MAEFDSEKYVMDVVTDKTPPEEADGKIFRLLKQEELDGYPAGNYYEPWEFSEYVFAFNCEKIKTDDVIFAVSSYKAEFEGVAPTIVSDVWEATVGADEPVDIRFGILHAARFVGANNRTIYWPDGLYAELVDEDTARIYSNEPLLEGIYPLQLRANNIGTGNEWTYHDVRFILTVGDGIANRPLAKPTVTWDVTQTDQETDEITANRVSWSAVSNASRYELKLSLDGTDAPLFETTVEAGSATEVVYADETNEIADAMNEHGHGLYTITVTAVSDNPNLTASEPGKAQYEYTDQTVEEYEGIVTTEGDGQARLNTEQSSFGAVSEKTADGMKAIVAEGGALTFDFVPAIGYELVSVTKDRTEKLGKKRSCTIRDISADFTLHVVFDLVHNRVDGITPEGAYEKGETLEITAIGHRMEAAIADETRWIPKYWQVDENGEASRKDEPYTGKIDTSALSFGNHMLKVKFQQQQYDTDSGSWVDVVDEEEPSHVYEIKEIAFKVEGTDEKEPSEDPTEPETPTNPQEPTDENESQDKPDKPTDSDDTSTGEKDPQEPSEDDADGSNEDTDGADKEEGEGTKNDNTDGNGGDPGEMDRTDGETSGRSETEDSGIEGIVNSVVNTVRTADPMELTIWFAAFAVSAGFLLSSVVSRWRKGRKGEPPVDCHRFPRR